MTRDDVLERLDEATVDLLVVGAGIVGSRVAYDAAHAGLSVALVDAGDFGGATSSASSKLVHGGLRYLATGDVRLVRDLQRERMTLMTEVAPHLVRPLPLLLVVEREHARRCAALFVALGLYSAIAGVGRTHPTLVGPGRAAELVPAVARERICLGGVVPEALTHDARLTLATVRAAAACGATVLNYARLVDLEPGHRAILRDQHDGHELRVLARAVVNATGPWVDHVRRLDRPDAPPLARLSKGVQAVLPLEAPWQAGLALFDESRTAIAIPWQGVLLVGATDVEHDDDPGTLEVTRADIEAVLAPLVRVAELDTRQILHAFAGLRVLPRGPGDTAHARREHLVEVAPSGLVSVAGGKLTTHRLIAAEVLRRLPWRVVPSSEPLPGAGPALLAGLDPEVAGHLAGLYGADAQRVAAYPGALERLHPDGPDVLGQVLYARDEEWALTVDDVVLRRTTLAVRGLANERVRERIARELGSARQLVAAV